MQVFDGIASKMTCLRLRKCAGMVIHRNPAWIKLINLIRFVSMRASGGWHALHFCQPKGIKVEQTNFEFHRNATHVSECYLVFNNRAQVMNRRLRTSHMDISLLSMCCLSSVLITYAVHPSCYINCNDYKHK